MIRNLNRARAETQYRVEIELPPAYEHPPAYTEVDLNQEEDPPPPYSAIIDME